MTTSIFTDYINRKNYTTRGGERVTGCVLRGDDHAVERIDALGDCLRVQPDRRSSRGMASEMGMSRSRQVRKVIVGRGCRGHPRFLLGVQALTRMGFKTRYEVGLRAKRQEPLQTGLFQFSEAPSSCFAQFLHSSQSGFTSSAMNEDCETELLVFLSLLRTRAHAHPHLG
jgi:hypothetical protein